MSAAEVLTGPVVAAVLSSGVLWGVLQTFINRHERKTRRRQGELDREQKEIDRSDLLAEAQSISQRTALESANIRYKNMETDYIACRRGLGEIRDAAALIIDVFDNVMMKLRPTRGNSESFTVTLQAAEVLEVRRSIGEARRHLLYFTDWKVTLEDDDE